MAQKWLIEQSVDLAAGSPSPRVWAEALMLCGDNQAHTWRVAVREAGADVPLTGCAVTGYFIRADGQTVVVQGSAAGNVASVTLAQACYACEGELRAVLRMSKSGAVVTLSALVLRVRREITSAMVDPGDVIPSLDDLLAQVAALEALEQSVSTAESGRVSAESKRASNETSRQNAETARASAETSRVSAEATRVTNENARKSAETARASAESNRASAETGRANAESVRASNETSRRNAETARASAETARASAESARASAETARESAEALRRASLNGLSFAINAEDGGLDITYNE